MPLPPGSIAVDSSGYIFATLKVGSGQYELVGIAPSGQILWTIATGDPFGIKLDPQGNLYAINDDSGHVDVYATPESNPNLIRSVCLRRHGPVAIAISSRGTLFMSFIANRGSHAFITRVRDTAGQCPLPGGQFGMYVEDSPPFYFSLIAAGFGAVFTIEPGAKRLLQLDPSKGYQVPIADVRYSGFLDPYDIAVGP